MHNGEYVMPSSFDGSYDWVFANVLEKERVQSFIRETKTSEDLIESFK